MNVDLNQIINAAALDAKYELRGSKGSFKGNQMINQSNQSIPRLKLSKLSQVDNQKVKISQEQLMGSNSQQVNLTQQEISKILSKNNQNLKSNLALDEKFIRAESTEFILSSKGLEATDEGIMEQFASIANRQTVKNKVTMFEKRTSKVINTCLPAELRSSQTTTFAQNPIDIKMARLRQEMQRNQVNKSGRTGIAARDTIFEKDYMIRLLDDEKNEVELKLAHSNFECIPRDILQVVSNMHLKENDSTKEDESDQNRLMNKALVSLNLEQNKLQELEGALFLHLGLNCKIELRELKASHNQIKYISSRIKDCEKLQLLRVSNNKLSGNDFLPMEMLNSVNFQNNLQFLYLSNNNIRDLPTHIGKLKNLKVLDLVGNKLRSIYYKVLNKQGRQQYICPLQGLDSLEELYLNENRLRDLPSVFHYLGNLKIIGLDWFSYLGHPLSLPKILESGNDIQLLKQNSEFQLIEKQNQYMTFKQFAQGFSLDKKYNINSQSEDMEMRTNLHQAVINDDRAMVNNLLKDGADPNLADFYSNTPLADAIDLENYEMAKIILKFSQKIDFSIDENRKLLILAVSKLNPDIMKMLLQAGCDPNTQYELRSGKNCLHFLMDQFQRAFENYEDMSSQVDEMPHQLDINPSQQLQLNPRQNTTLKNSAVKGQEDAANSRSDINVRNITNEMLDETVLIDNQLGLYDNSKHNQNREVDNSNTNTNHKGFAATILKKTGDRRLNAIGADLISANGSKSNRSNLNSEYNLMPLPNSGRQDLSSRRLHNNNSADEDDQPEFLNDLKKCQKILDMLIQAGMDLNLTCNQKYTPFLYAIKLGNVRLINYLLEKYKNCTGPFSIDVNSTGSAWKNTAFHIAGMRSKFDIMYVLMEHGADIFIRSRDGKTCFQYVNNNLLMLKLVKKLERKQFLKEQVDFQRLIMPTEAQIVYSYSVKLNTGSYKTIDLVIQKIKREFFRPTIAQKRPSIFAKKQSGRVSRQNSQARARENSVTGHIKCTDRSNEEKFQRVTYVDFLTEQELMQQRPQRRRKTQATDASGQRSDIFIKDSPRSSSVNFNLGGMMNTDQFSDITSNSKLRLSNVKIQNMNVSNWQESLKVFAGPRLQFDKSTIKSRKNLKVKQDDHEKSPYENHPTFSVQDNNLETQTFDQCNVIETSRPHQSTRPQILKNQVLSEKKINQLGQDIENAFFSGYNNKEKAQNQTTQKEKQGSQITINNFRNIIQNQEHQTLNKQLFQGNSQHFDQSARNMIKSKLSNEMSFISSTIAPVGLRDSVVSKNTFQQPKYSQNHKNIYFIKDQIFDKDRMKQIQYNHSVVNQVCYFEAKNKKAKKDQEEDSKKAKSDKPEQDDEKAQQKIEITSLTLPSQHLEYQQGGFSFTYAQRHTQEVKLLSQLRSIFNPKKKTHVKIMCEIVEKIYKLKDSHYMINEILDILSVNLQSINNSDPDSPEKQSFDNLMQAVHNLSENMSCPQFIQDQLDDILNISFSRKPLLFLHNQADIGDSIDDIDSSLKKQFQPRSENNLEHDLGGAADIDEFPSAKIGRYVQSHMQSEFASRRNQQESREETEPDQPHSRNLDSRQKRKVSIKRLHSVDLKSVAIDFRKKQSSARQDNSYRFINMKTADQLKAQRDEPAALISLAHIDKNPLTNCRDYHRQRESQANRASDALPYQDTVTIGGLESSGKVSIAISIDQVKIGQKAQHSIPGQQVSQFTQQQQQKGDQNTKTNNQISPRLSDEFSGVEQIQVTNEKPARVDLKIKNLSALTKKDYRSDTKPTAGDNMRRGIHQTQNNMHKFVYTQNKPLTTHTDHAFNIKKVPASHQLNFEQDQFSQDIHNKTLTSDQINGNENNIVVSDKFSPKTIQQPSNQENLAFQIHASKKKIILKKQDIKYRHKQIVQSARRNQSASRQTTQNDVHTEDNFDLGKVVSQPVDKTARSSNPLENKAFQFSARNYNRLGHPMINAKVGTFSALGQHEKDQSLFSGINKFQQDNQARDELNKLDLQLQYTFDSCESITNQQQPVKITNFMLPTHDPKQQQFNLSQKQAEPPSRQQLLLRGHHLRSQREKPQENMISGGVQSQLPHEDSESAINMPKRTHIDKMMTPTRSGKGLQNFQQIRTTAALKFGENQKKMGSRQVSEIDLSKQQSLAEKYTQFSKQHSSGQLSNTQTANRHLKHN